MVGMRRFFFFLCGMRRGEETPAAPYVFGGSFRLRHCINGRVGTRARLLVVVELNPLKPLLSAVAPDEELPYPFGRRLILPGIEGMTTLTTWLGTRAFLGRSQLLGGACGLRLLHSRPIR